MNPTQIQIRQKSKIIANIEYYWPTKPQETPLIERTFQQGFELLTGESDLEVQIIFPPSENHQSAPARQIHLKGQILENGQVEVYLNGQLLDPALSQQVYNHSPDGFAWGYSGSGPAQLALAICLELYPINQALEVYQDFKERYITPLDQDQDFELTITL